jgi:hypothetical protein
MSSNLIIIDGVASSGTTILTYLLSKHPDVVLVKNGTCTRILENDWLLNRDHEKIDAAFAGLGPGKKLLLKRPWSIYRFTGWLLEHYPEAYYVYSTRREEDVIRSWQKPESLVGDNWGRLRSDAEYARGVLNEAHDRAEAFRRVAQQFTVVSHENLIYAPVPMLKDLTDWLGLAPFRYPTEIIGSCNIKAPYLEQYKTASSGKEQYDPSAHI